MKEVYWEIKINNLSGPRQAKFRQRSGPRFVYFDLPIYFLHGLTWIIFNICVLNVTTSCLLTLGLLQSQGNLNCYINISHITLIHPQWLEQSSPPPPPLYPAFRIYIKSDFNSPPTNMQEKWNSSFLPLFYLFESSVACNRQQQPQVSRIFSWKLKTVSTFSI